MHAASFLATGFSIVTTLSRTKIIARHLVNNYGMSHLCRQIRAIDLPVLDLETDTEIKTIILEECRKAISEDDCGAIVLGCGGMADLASQIGNILNIPVIDGVSAAVKFVEALAGLKLFTSKTGDLAYPIAKPYTGMLSSFELNKL